MKAWEEFLIRHEQLLSKPIIDKWLRSLKVAHFDSGNLYLEASDSFQILWFEEHIRPLLKTQLHNNNFRKIKVHLTLQQDENTLTKAQKRDKIKTLPPLILTPDKLDPLATLQNFIPGKANEIPFRFLYELTGYLPPAKSYGTPSLPLATFNPIYFYGPSGCGKTHLLMALAHAFKQMGKNVLYARSETFTEHVVAAIRSSNMAPFRKAYRHVDLLIIDDVHLFSRKNATQEEFFHTFNALHTTGRQLILSANCAPSALSEIEPRLVSRFEWGIALQIEKLHKEELKEVLSLRCEALQFPLSDELSSYIVDHFPTSHSIHRALEALILRTHLRHEKAEKPIDLLTAQELLHDLVQQETTRVLCPQKIIAQVASQFGVRTEDLLGKAQHQEISFPRQIAMYLLREKLRMPFTSIGQLFTRDHSTVMTSVKQIQKKIEEKESETQQALAQLMIRS